MLTLGGQDSWEAGIGSEQKERKWLRRLETLGRGYRAILMKYCRAKLKFTLTEVTGSLQKLIQHFNLNVLLEKLHFAFTCYW